MGLIKKCYHWLRRRVRAARASIKRTSSSLPMHNGDVELNDDIEGGSLPSLANPSEPHRMSDAISRTASEPSSPISQVSSVETAMPNTPVTPTKGKQLWKNAFKSVKMHSAMSSLMKLGPPSPARQRTTSSAAAGERKKTNGEEPVKAVLRSRVAALVPKLKILDTTQDLAAHQALVRHLQFSPDGKYLATSSWDKTSVIFRVGDPFISHRTLAHAQGFVGQVAWSDTGNLLLTKLGRGMKIWTEDGVCKKTIERRTTVESITWCPGGEAFMSVESKMSAEGKVEGSNVTKLDLDGKILDQYNFGQMKLHDVAVTPDSLRLLGVGPLLKSPDGLQPSKSRVEKQLVVFNMETKVLENQTPVLNDVRDITLARNSRNGLVALVSYENKAPPQLWRMELVRDRENSAIMTARLTLRHTYMPKVPVNFAGPSYFGGKNDELVLCAGKAGDIHIWDQESGALLHHVRAQALGGDLTCIAWNHAADNPFMFATGSHDGAVRVWTKPPDDSTPEQEDMPPRTSSPYEMDRTDSPITQEDFESQHHESSQNVLETGAPPRERMVAFAAGPPRNVYG